MIRYASQFIWIQICRYILYRGFGKWILNMNHNGSCIHGFQYWVRRDRGGLDEMIETLSALVRANWTMVGDRVDFENLIQPRIMEAESELESDWILSFWFVAGFWIGLQILVESNPCWTGIQILLNLIPNQTELESKSYWIQILLNPNRTEGDSSRIRNLFGASL